MTSSPTGVLVTGGAGYLGRQVVAGLAARPDRFGPIVSTDVRDIPQTELPLGVEHRVVDVRDGALAELCAERGISSLVHLAAIVNPGPKPDRALLHSVEVEGTRNVLEACRAGGVGHIVVTSSGAAYGYYADHPRWIGEDAPIRGNPEFAYSDHKRQVEEMLEAWRREHPELRQLVFRPGTILGTTTRNQITDIFDRKVVVGLRGADIPFVLIWDQDVVGAILQGVEERATGIYNMAGDGAMPLREVAARMGKPYLALPVPLVRTAQALMKRLGVTQYGPEQVNFLRYRPVLSNRRLKEEFGYVPQKTTREVFELFLESRRGAST